MSAHKAPLAHYLLEKGGQNKQHEVVCVLDLLSDYFFITILLSHMVLRLMDLIPANLLAIVAS